jgi:DNA processing protein
MAWIALGCLIEPGNRELGTLARRVGPVEAFGQLFDGGVSERLRDAAAVRLLTGWRGLPGAGGPADALRMSDLRKRADPVRIAHAALRRAERLGARIVTPDCEEWPHQVDDLARISREGTANGPVDRDTDPPVCLWVRGEPRLDDVFERSLAMVGARAASHYGSNVASDLAYGLADRGWTIVSGGAFGIDAAAHRAALAAGGVSVAVLACGVDRAYPAGHSGLFERIAEDGLVISEWPAGASPHRHRFLIRNRVIAAATRGTVVVEAASRSGARQTLGRARLLGRAAMAVPGPVTSALSVGCHAELRLFNTRLVTNVAEVLEEVGRIGDDLAPVPRGGDRPHDGLDPLAFQILDAVGQRKARTAEQIAAVAGVTAREARRTLPFLVAAGFVVVNDGSYRLAKPAKETT